MDFQLLQKNGQNTVLALIILLVVPSVLDYAQILWIFEVNALEILCLGKNELTLLEPHIHIEVHAHAEFDQAEWYHKFIGF